MPDPFAGRPGARLYRTGDLGRMLPEGEIEFLGRSDHQVKIRGFRIELGEIESQLSRHPAVRETVVVARTDRTGQRYLCAYVVAPEAPSAEQMKAHLGESLPAYMIPDVFVALAELPLTANGKVDRKALPEPEVANLAGAGGYVAPEGEVEIALAEIWEEVLGTSGIGVGHDFFALGGHSLSAIQVLTRVRRRFEVDLPLPDFFEQPTIAGLAVTIERLRREGRTVHSQPLARRARPERLPLSFAQERLWFLDRLQPNSSVYNIPLALGLKGRLVWPVLAASLNEVAARHEGLRTTFALAEGRPVQVIAPVLLLDPAVIDLSGLPEGLRKRESKGLGVEEAARPFDLEQGPLVRAALLRLAEEHHIALFTVHHIVADGWSMGVLVREVGELYQALSHGERPSLPELPIQYADFALWQREWLSGPVLDEQIAFWRRRLEGAPALLELPTDRPRPAMQTYRGAKASIALGPDLMAGMAELQRSHGATLFQTLLAAFQALLARLANQQDVVVGSPLAGRNRIETENLIGFFVNTLALRSTVREGQSFADLLAQVRETTVASYAHEDLPFEKLVEELQPERSLAYSPLFQVVLVLQNAPMGSLELPDLVLEPVHTEEGSTKFDLTMSLTEASNGMIGFWEFATDLFDGATIRRFQGHFKTLLQNAVSDPAQRVSELPLLTEQERRQLLIDWNIQKVSGLGQACLHEIFAKQAARRPEAVAVSCEEWQMTYSELRQRADQLARHLRSLGVGPEVPAALCLERSPEMVVAILAVLQAGGAYVPIDPAYPRERQAFILEDSRTPVLISERRLVADLPASGAHLVCLDEKLPERDGEILGGATPQSLAYVIYTSGSTGKPKGVLVRHENVVRLFEATDPWFGFGEHDVWTLFHSYAFDFSVWEIWGALLYGGRLVVVPYWASRSPEAFHKLLRNERVTVLNQTPSAFRQLTAADAALDPIADLRLVIFGGEALDPQSLRPWFERYGDARPLLVNMYGITETTVHVTYRPIAARDLDRLGSPIGGAIPDLSLRVLDRSLQPAPIGVPGELCVGGAGLARGYLNRPELTAERFTPDPFAQEPGARLYRSGDLARYRPDGDVEHLGRIDHQVKIRGFRIELGEIEAVLAAHAGVREIAVIVREDEPGDRRLVAYVVPAGPEVTASVLREYVRERQPEPMVPAAFVLLDRLPLTAHGKVDRKTLPSPERVRSKENYVAPRTLAERELAGIWADLLALVRVGAEDNFFALGGDSIKAVRLVSRVNEQLGASLQVQDIFQYQSLAALAARLVGSTAASLAEEHAAGLIQIERLKQAVLADERQRTKLPAGYEDFFPLSSIEKGMIYYSLLLPEQPVYHDQHTYLLSIPDTERFYRALSLLTGRHPVFRTTFHLYDFEEPMKVVHARIDLEPDVEDLSGHSEEEQRHRIEQYRDEDLREKFAFDGRLLWRLKLFRLGGNLHYAVWSWHHAIIDGWSNVTFWTELNDFSARPDLERLENLPPLINSYKDYLAISLGRSRSAATEAFWRETLAGSSRNKLPFNRATTRERTAYGMQTVHHPLSNELLAGLRVRAREHNTSLQAVCLAAHIHLLHLTSGEEDVLTGVVTNDRPGIPDGDKIIGCFLNTVPVRLQLARGDSGSELLRRVSRYLAMEKQHEIPLVDIAALLGARQTAENPLFDTLFNYMDFHVAEDVEENVLFQPTASSSSRKGISLQSNEMTNTLFDLEVSATLGSFFVRIKYSPRYFEKTDVNRAAVLYQQILEALARAPETPLGAESLLSPEEREQLISVYNDTVRDYPRERPLHSFFEEQAALYPERVAVVGAGRELTYEELDEQANRLARHLLGQGVEPGDNVGVCFERTPELLIALMAVLKVAAAYVPLEPDYPAARKGYIVRQSGVRKILADRLYELPEGCAAEIVLFAPEVLGIYSAEPLSLRPRPEDLAYTIYTSGSTGTPKGVMIEHHSAVNLINWVNRELRVRPETRVLAVSSVCFDLSVYDVFGALGAGATLVLARQEQVQDPAALLRLVLDQRVTFWNSVPSTLGLLVQYLEETEPGFRGEDLEIAFLSGDWIPLS
ncbi:MAG TPA: amino acid adenylation domain-containing protein, partial [Thermoanaerobaculia bacterium]